MARLSYLDSAKEDLVHILRYITTQSGSLAIGQDFVAALRQKCRHLAGLPGHMGRPRPELREDIRSFAFRGYVIFFRYVGDKFEVVNILEGHRDIDTHFDDTE
ncbi:MAG TPA: type II toxin-antitoxin system RelE/ParE family toxin [Ensifer sp.]|nr:type II toxin-antitoxin system RelE/ParE family toxin [Ensifer sp.]